MSVELMASERYVNAKFNSVYTKDEVDAKVAGVQTFRKYLVNALPDPEAADEKGLYLVSTGETSEVGDLCDEYTVVGEAGARRWERIGGAAVSIAWANVTDKPTFAAVATSGEYADLTGKPTIPVVPTPVTPSTDASAQGKPADALATGTLLDYLGTEKQDVLSATQLANIAAVPGKADAADLRYRIADAGYATTGAKLPDGVTVRMNGEVVSYEIEPSSSPLRPDNVYWRMVVAGETAFIWEEDGTNGASGMLGYKFYDANGDEMQTIPDLLVPRALADRTVNLITATNEASIDIELPAAVTVDGVRYGRDFFLDIDNSVNASDLALEFVELGQSYAFVAADGDSVGDIMTIAGYGTGSQGDGEIVRLYFTETPHFADAGTVPVIQVARVTLGDFVTSIPTTTQGGN